MAVNQNLERATAEQGIIDTLKAASGPVASTAVIQRLKDQGLQEDLIKRALWYLIEYQKIRFTPERRLIVGEDAKQTDSLSFDDTR